MSDMQLAKRAIRLYSSAWAPKHINRFNQRSYIASIRSLGDKWLLAKPVQKEASNG